MKRPQRNGGTVAVRRFARDVGVNVAGNLVTAAIIYVAGAAAGLIPSNSYVIASAVVVLFSTAVYGLFIVAQFYADERRFILYGGGPRVQRSCRISRWVCRSAADRFGFRLVLDARDRKPAGRHA
jgi:hypothetical protein